DTYRHWQQPGHDWQALDGPYYPKPTPEEVEKTLEAIVARIKAENWPEIRTRLIIADRESDTLLGMVSRYWISEETHWPALGITIFDPDYWGKGIGYEALGLWMDYLFAQYPEWVRLDLRTWSGNHGMIRLAQKLGYREEARFRKARIVNGEHYDGLGFGILREEWQSQFGDGFMGRM
ncbi:MAG: GNAT family protein, partial [Chloroflexota bacterium]